MRHSVRAVVVVALALGASPLRAQNPGLPVYNLGVPRGIGLYGDIAFPNAAARTVRHKLRAFGLERVVRDRWPLMHAANMSACVIFTRYEYTKRHRGIV